MELEWNLDDIMHDVCFYFSQEFYAEEQHIHAS